MQMSKAALEYEHMRNVRTLGKAGKDFTTSRAYREGALSPPWFYALEVLLDAYLNRQFSHAHCTDHR